MHTLESFLSRRNDSSTQTVLLEYVVKELSKQFKGDSKTIKQFFWKGLGDMLDSEITNSTKSSQFLLQVLQAGYPKLLRIFLDLYSRIKLVSGDEIQLLSLTNFEGAYITRSFTRLNEAVSNILQKGTPNRDDGTKLGRTVSSELNATRFDPELLSKIAINVTKSLTTFSTKVETLVIYDTKITISGSTLPQTQVVKVDIINCLYNLSEAIWGLVIDYDGNLIQASLVTLSIVKYCY
jgi:conserved oligomeric Golgi complex subunit 5